MNKNEKKGFIITIAVMAVLMTVLIGVIVVLVMKGRTSQEQKVNHAIGQMTNDDTKENRQDSGENEDVFNHEIEEDAKQVYGGYEIVIDGFKVRVPADYGCYYLEDVGPVVYLDDLFQMKLKMREGSYEEIMKNPDALTQGTIDAGGEVIQEVRETELEGKKYVYFRMILEGDEMFVAHTQAAGADIRVAAQTVVLSDDITDEDLLHVFAQIANTAEETKEPNTTAEDLARQSAQWIMGEKKSESTLTYRGKSITFQVPERFYSQYVDETDYYITESFADEDYVITADCYLKFCDVYEDACAYIENEADILGLAETETVNIQTEDGNSKTFYYILAQYESDGSENQKISAACDIGDSVIYTVEASVIDEDVELTLDTIREFLCIGEHK